MAGGTTKKTVRAPLERFSYIGTWRILRLLGFCGPRDGRAGSRIQLIGSAGPVVSLCLILIFIIKVPVHTRVRRTVVFRGMFAGRARLRWPAAKKRGALALVQLQYRHYGRNTALQISQALAIFFCKNFFIPVHVAAL